MNHKILKLLLVNGVHNHYSNSNNDSRQNILAFNCAYSDPSFANHHPSSKVVGRGFGSNLNKYDSINQSITSKSKRIPIKQPCSYYFPKPLLRMQVPSRFENHLSKQNDVLGRVLSSLEQQNTSDAMIYQRELDSKVRALLTQHDIYDIKLDAQKNRNFSEYEKSRNREHKIRKNRSSSLLQKYIFANIISDGLLNNKSNMLESIEKLEIHDQKSKSLGQPGFDHQGTFSPYPLHIPYGGPQTHNYFPYNPYPPNTYNLSQYPQSLPPRRNPSYGQRLNQPYKEPETSSEEISRAQSRGSMINEKDMYSRSLNPIINQASKETHKKKKKLKKSPKNDKPTFMLSSVTLIFLSSRLELFHVYYSLFS